MTDKAQNTPNQNSNTFEEQKHKELAIKFQMFEQQIQQINQQLQAVEQAINELNSIDLGLDNLKNSTGKEILAQVGRGIFAKTKLIDEDLIVDIGEKTFVKKTIPETQEILKTQIEKLKEAQGQLNCNLEEINSELTNVFMEAQKNSKHSCSCGDECNHDECGDDCECDEECECEK